MLRRESAIFMGSGFNMELSYCSVHIYGIGFEIKLATASGNVDSFIQTFDNQALQFFAGIVLLVYFYSPPTTFAF